MAGKSPLLKMFAFSRYAFDTPAQAQRLLRFLIDSPFPATRFGRGEPVREKLTSERLGEAAELLTGDREYPGGSLFIASTEPRSSLMFTWSPGAIAQWYGEFDAARLPESVRRETLVHFFAGLLREFPAVFGGIAPEEDWRVKHWKTEEDEDEGEVVTKVGLDLERCLPGVYWLTAFGRELVQHFGAERLKALPQTHAIDLGPGGLLLPLDAGLSPEERPSRAKQEAQVVRSLGPAYFFDVSAEDRACKPIPGVTPSI